MTTGRINQVTILSQSAEAKWQTPQRERVVPSKKAPKRPKSQLYSSWKPKYRMQLIQLPPLSSPKASPQRAIPDVAIKRISGAYSPQEEKTHALSRRKGGNLAGQSPKIW
jgi:hypothetical protein